MQITVDPDTRSVYVRMNDYPAMVREKVSPQVSLDFDRTGQVCGVVLNEPEVTKQTEAA